MEGRIVSQKQQTQRQLRVGEQVRHALSELLQRGELRDEPGLDGALLAISEVRMSPDLKIATAFVSTITDLDPEAAVTALNRNARRIRGRLSGALGQMKYMPEFRFRADTSYDNFARIDALLRSPAVARDLDRDDREDE